jgi:hypothetical protein
MTASTADYYGILGLTSDATLADVKKAYRKLARQHHPDRNNADPGAVDRFRRITEAYECLSAHLKDNARLSGPCIPWLLPPVMRPVVAMISVMPRPLRMPHLPGVIQGEGASPVTDDRPVRSAGGGVRLLWTVSPVA